jgi:hypothetical protein
MNSNKRPLSGWNGFTPCGSGISQFLTDNETTKLLRHIHGHVVQQLVPFMNGEWSGDGTGMGFSGDFRMILDVKKKRNAQQGVDDPAQIETVEYDSMSEARANGHDVTWESGWKMPEKNRDYRRVIVFAAHPYMIIGDVRVYNKSIGEREAVKPIVGTINSLELPFKRFRGDGGLNGTLVRDLIISGGAEPLVPYPRNAKNAYNAKFENELDNLAAICEAFAFWKNHEAFEAAYSPRSMIENVFSVLKRRHPRITTHERAAPENEILLMVIEHNIIRMLQLMYLAGAPPAFKNARRSLAA